MSFIHKQLRDKVGCRFKGDSISGESIHNGRRQCVVCAVAFGTDEIRVEVPRRGKVGRVPQPYPRLIENLFVELAGQHRLGHPVAAKEPHHRAHAANADPFVRVADPS